MSYAIGGGSVTNAWIVRAGSDRLDRLHLDRNVITVGWAGTGDLSSGATVDEIRDLMVEAHPDLNPTRAEGHVFQLLAFAHKMERGDAVLAPRHGTPSVAIGEITGDYRFRTDLHPEVSHTRTVRWIHDGVPRVAFGDDLLEGSALNAVMRVNAERAVQRVWHLARHERDIASADAGVEELHVTPFANLRRNLNYARSLATAGQALGQLEVRAFEIDDVFRAAWVQGVAALDHWVRQEVHTRMLLLARNGTADRPSGFAKFEITLDLVERVHRGELALHEALEMPLWTVLSRTTYQRPDRIKEGLGMVTDAGRLWERVATVLSERPGGEAVTASDVRGRLNEIVERRNKIAHEYDEDPSDRRGKRQIDAASATATIEWIEQLATAVLEVIDQPGR
ncbi:hypothetical protein [Pseudosporangium ferrugineum]|uniref:Restriction system protein n=1 Tax=Pseudosporangium ferrugineum TaxID=439699 RepID=A0A2T0RC10_9ACTN|nr:hypothetical protein [Pseudosporangium ferrugineum]PRY18679.1 restriction system protein [Pseudosporangium ferrugineum]